MTMKRTGIAILLLSTLVVFPGCGNGDPGQPPIGSISVGKKSEDGPKLPAKKRKTFSNDR
jgi:hypothetical protein